MADIGKAYVQIIPKAEGISGSISSAIGGEANSAGITAGNSLVSSLKGVIAAAGIGKALSDSITTGMDFDKSISQVAATMGLTMDEMANKVGTVDTAWGEFNGNLRDYAQFMGSNTAFSATEAADALNYMALAGYDAQTSMDMLPNVLNLAAAGDIDLASASDMVTDAQTALGLTLDETSTMVDQMAKTASKSNTSVAQLGDAYLTIGANARSLAGGTNELSTVLGVLADNGIKGSEAGTHLRNIILSLTPTTDKAAAAWERLGVSGYDAQGNLRALPDVFADLNKAMAGMTEEEKTDMFSAMFNKTDLASIKALVGTTTERFDELSAAIASADGAAQQMADTQLDNLAGDVTLFKSALEGVQIAISDKLTPLLREFVQLGTELMSGLTSAIKDGDFSGLEELGRNIIEKIKSGFAQSTDFITGLLDKITEGLPAFLDKGVEIIGNLTSGFMSAIPRLLEVAGSIVTSLVTFILQNAPAVLSAGIEIVRNIAQSIRDNLPAIAEKGVEIVSGLAQSIITHLPEIIKLGYQLMSEWRGALMSNLPTLISAAGELIGNIVQTVKDNLPALLETGKGILSNIVSGISTALPTIISTASSIISTIVSFIKDNLPQLLASGAEILKGIFDGISQNSGGLLTKGAEILKGIVDGIVNGLSVIGEVVLSIISKIGEFIASNAPTLLEKGGEILSNLASGILTKIEELAPVALEMVNKIGDTLTQNMPNILAKGVELISNLVNGILQSLPQLISTAGTLMTSFVDFILTNMPTVLSAGADLIVNLAQGIVQNLPEIISSATTVTTNFLTTLAEHAPDIIASGIEIIGKLIAGLIQAIPDLIAALPEIISAIWDTITAVDWLDLGLNIIKGIAQGIFDGVSVIVEAAVEVAKKAFDSAKEALSVHSPSKKGMWLGEMFDKGFAIGIETNTDSVQDAMADMNESVMATLQTPSSGKFSFENANADNDKMDDLLGILGNYLPEIASNKGVTAKELYSGLNRQLGVALS